jgi:hypothetical protein
MGARSYRLVAILRFIQSPSRTLYVYPCAPWTLDSVNRGINLPSSVGVDAPY